MKNKHILCVGPLLLSALSLFISFFLVQSFATWLDPSFNLLASRGIGKVVFICMVIYQIILFLTTQSKPFLKNFFQRNLFFLVKEKWLQLFSKLFLLFFTLHACFVALFYYSGYLVYNPNWGLFSATLIVKTLFGLFVVFMLAWTEELIFRGTLYPYFAQYYKPLTSMIIGSAIFMFVHNLTNPLALITTDWKLGLFLFLLGILLNQLFIITNKLYAGMGAHAGLVFVKVIFRRARFLVFVPESQWAWWVHQDLRQSLLINILFICVVIFLFIKYKKSFIKTT